MKYPRYYLKLFTQAGKVVYSYATRRQKSILYRLNTKHQRDFIIEIRVVYAPGYENCGQYTGKHAFLRAYNAFCDPDLINEFAPRET